MLSPGTHWVQKIFFIKNVLIKTKNVGNFDIFFIKHFSQGSVTVPCQIHTQSSMDFLLRSLEFPENLQLFNTVTPPWKYFQIFALSNPLNINRFCIIIPLESSSGILMTGGYRLFFFFSHHYSLFFIII